VTRFWALVNHVSASEHEAIDAIDGSGLTAQVGALRGRSAARLWSTEPRRRLSVDDAAPLVASAGTPAAGS